MRFLQRKALTARILFVSLVTVLAPCAWAATSGGGSRLKTEVLALPYGAELVTIFATMPSDAPGVNAAELPLVSVVRDTLNESDPGAARLRKVWVLTYTRPNLLQRTFGAFPFFFRRAGSNRGSTDGVPASVLDLSSPHRGSIQNVLALALQSEFLDPNGLYLRAFTRTYRGNAREYERIHIEQALGAIARLESGGDSGAHALSATELENIQARLSLDKRLLGGFVRNSQLGEVYESQRTQAQMSRQHNWEVLRQKAEQNGLHFQPLAFGQELPGDALLWIAKEDLENGSPRRFDASLLSLSDPWRDEHLRRWKGYSETWSFDAEGRRVQDGQEGAKQLHMIPLALYSLDYPRAPLLLVDFRSEWQPKRRELSSRTADSIASGLLGYNGISHLGYFAAKTSWQWFRGRHGGAVDRNARIDAYAGLRHALFVDDGLNPDLKKQITRRLDALALNPFEQDFDCESEMAKRQYAALIAYAHDPNGLERTLARERGRELVAFTHGSESRAWLNVATIATLGIYRHREPVTPDALARLDRERRIQARVAFLEHALASSPQLDVVWDMEEIRKSLEELPELQATGANEPISKLVARVFSQTSDEVTRRDCLRCLYRLNSTSARQELSRLSNDEMVSPELRADCQSYLLGIPPLYAAAAGAGQ